MKRLIYQVNLGQSKNCKLYNFCVDSVKAYCDKHAITHIIQTAPKLRIAPDPFTSNRSKESHQKHGGFLPIFEKENAFDLLDDYDQICILDADIYVRHDAPNIFDDFGVNDAWGGVCEREMNIDNQYKAKIQNYSKMQYDVLHKKNPIFKPNDLGYEFFNMGLILLNTQLFKPYLKDQNAKTFLSRLEFKDFVDGIGAWKWSTDQTLLNYFLKKYKVPVKHMSWQWNGLYGSVPKIKECFFVHFFLKDKLPSKGENVKELIKLI